MAEQTTEPRMSKQVDRVYFTKAISDRDAWKERAQAAERALLDIMNRVDDVLPAEYRI